VVAVAKRTDRTKRLETRHAMQGWIKTKPKNCTDKSPAKVLPTKKSANSLTKSKTASKLYQLALFASFFIKHMIIKPRNSDSHSLLAKLSELIGKNIFQAHHTYGTMFLFDMGKKTEKLSLGQLLINGENTVIVENYTWTIKQKRIKIVNSKDSASDMRRKIPTLVGKEIVNIKMEENGSNRLIFSFSDDIALEVTLSETKDRDIGIRLKNSHWIDIGPRNTWVEVTADHVDK